MQKYQKEFYFTILVVKKNLYLYLYDYVTAIFTDAINNSLDSEEPDIFKRYKQIMMMKLALIQQYHTLFDFLKKDIC